MSRSQSQLSLSTEEITSLLRAFPQGVVGVDLETTGLSPLVDKIIEIAAVKISSSGEVSTFHTLINPLTDIPEFTIQFHGLTNNDVKNAPTIKKPLKEFWQFCEKLPMVAHNASFDLGYLIKASHDFLLDFPVVNIYDSCRFARAVYKGKETTPSNFKLSTLCDFFQVPLLHHVAIEDTFACLKVFAHSLSQEMDLQVMLDRSFVFRLSNFQKSECFNFSTRLNGLKDLVQQKSLVTLDYRGASKNGKLRPVRPIGLMPLPQGAVLFAECLISGMNKSFLLKKIKSYSKLEASYWRPGV
ncbi:MAG TPA: 3'-5' exonuclease [Bacteriovoracaceae bacterium]|nr:3'-5' exonuclease [Bacteriovoracaceae bacterium]